MKKFFINILILFPFACFAQHDTMYVLINKDKTKNVISDKEPYNVITKEPEFEGGIENFYKQFRKKLEIPNTIKNTKNVISVIFKFTILEDGSITNLKNSIVGFHAPVHESLSKEIDKALKKMPKWIPAEKAGKKVRYDQVLSWKITIR